MARKSSPPPTRRAAPAPAAAPRRSAPPPPPAAPAARAAPPAPMAAPQSSGGGMLAGLGSTMAQGFAFGTGSALAREAVSSIFGGSSSKPEVAAPAAPAPTMPSVSGPCQSDQTAFMRCLQENPGNAGNCDFYYNALQQCQTSSF